MPVIVRPAGFGFEFLDGYRCACGKRKPLPSWIPSWIFEPRVNARAAKMLFDMQPSRPWRVGSTDDRS